VAYKYLLNMPRRNTSNLFEYSYFFTIDTSNLFEYYIAFCFEGTTNRFTIDAGVLKYISLVSIL